MTQDEIIPNPETKEYLRYRIAVLEGRIEELETALELLHKEMRWSVSQFTFDRAMNVAAKALGDTAAIRGDE